jgi:SNF2 family DNA or RNA helicase
MMGTTENRTSDIAARLPEQGQMVSVRHHLFVVSDVTRCTLPQSPLSSSNGTQHLVSLTSVEDDALGEELQVIWEIEPDAYVYEKVALPESEEFDPPPRLDAFLHAVCWGASSNADFRTLQAPFRSGIEIEDYQLDPVVRAIQMPRVNLLIADDVGLGKTIEAGLVIQELITRHRIRKVLVVCPAHLQIHWRDQMREKFGLEFRIVDGELRHDLRRKRGLHVNPWTHFPRLITSVDYLKRERPLRLFREALPQEGESLYPRRFDMLVVDEAHNIAPSGRGKYATDSLRTSAVRLLAPHFEHKIFISATPHNGYQESFTALLELLDNQRFSRGIAPNGLQLHQIMVRRLKSELQGWSGAPSFPKRTLQALEVDYSADELALHRTLEDYSKSRLANTREDTDRLATEFVLKILKKRLFSSPAAFQTTLKQHENTLRGSARTIARPSVSLLQQQLDRLEEDVADDQEYEDNTQSTVESTTRLFAQLTESERSLLRKMTELAGRFSAQADSKARELVRWLNETIKPDGKWSNERVILFTEYRATQKWLQTILAAHGFSGGNRMMAIYGGLDSDTREGIKNAFQAPPDRSPVRILLATDAASEGIDLQNYCHRLIHYEIPWNPNRMEQRNGRVDRHGQKADEVLIYHFVGKGFQERLKKYDQGDLQTIKPGNLQGDMEFLMVAARKIETIRDDLGKVGPVIARQVEEAMLGRRSRLDTSTDEREASPVRAMLRFERKMKEQIASLHEQLVETQSELEISPANVQAVVETALSLSGQPPLQEARVPGIWPDPAGKRSRCPVFHLPHLMGSWSLCSEGLADPHAGAVRPITFDHTLAQQTRDIVLCHLNHRLVQMSLRLLRAEVWSRQGLKLLHRVTARLVPDNVLPTPALVAHARLVVIGGDSHRLHEEIITAGGRIHEGRFRRLNVGEVGAALKAALPEEPGEKVKEQLRKLWAPNRDSLASALEARMEDRFKSLQKALGEREEKEGGDIEAVLTELQRLIREKIHEFDSPMQLDWVKQLDPNEKDQWETDMNGLRQRLSQIPKEIEQEKEHIQDRFKSPQCRLFPVAVTWLVPNRLNR